MESKHTWKTNREQVAFFLTQPWLVFRGFKLIQIKKQQVSSEFKGAPFELQLRLF